MEDDTDQLSELLEEFLQAVRSGQDPQVEDYVRRYPRLAERIRELFPTVLLVEGKAAPSRSGSTSPAQHQNPYLSRVMIEQPSRFYGRQRELGRIFSRIGSSRPQSVSVVGERRIGKSSLLNALTWPEMQERYLTGPGALAFVYIDFQQLPNIQLPDFFDLLIARIAATLPELEATPHDNQYRRYQNVLEGLREKETGLVILLDEFDSVTSNPAFGPDFYSFLRSCANNYPVAYITSSKLDLQRLCHSTTIADSPFFNIFSNLYLRGFTREEALDLIRNPSENAGLPLQEFVPEILDLGGYFPLYLQIACSVYFDWSSETGALKSPVAELKEAFLEEATAHFSYFWEHCNSEKKEILRQLAREQQPEPAQQFWCRQLQRSGYVEKEGDAYQLFSPTFAEQIQMMDSFPGSDPGTSGERTAGLADLETGTAIQQYRILSLVAKGGMGVVYRAEDESLRREVAIKVCRSELASDDTARQRALQEARTAAALKHPSIASVYELLEHQQMPVIVMEWVEGRTLAQILKEEGPYPWRRLLPLIIQASDALVHAHRAGVIHRDLKPSNLMVDNDGQVKITDFGLAKYRGNDRASAQNLTLSGAILGTVNYMSPEQARGETLDQRSDLFSMGVVLFESLTGRLPFQRRGLPATLQAIISDPAPYLGLYRIENADNLDRVVSRLLEKSPEDRFQSAAELRQELDRLLSGRRSLLSWIRGRFRDLGY